MDVGGVDDRRLMGRETYLRGRRLTLRPWWPYRDGWDHDHCAFCQRHISVPLATDDPDAVDRGYVSEDDYHWVCETPLRRFSRALRLVDRRLNAPDAANECVRCGRAR
jgi:hypothetical protein